MQRLRVPYNFGCRALCNLPWRARFNVTFPPLRLCYEKARTCFSKDAENLTCSYVLSCSQIVCIRPYALNITIAFILLCE